MTVFWTNAALNHLLAIRAYLAATSETFAERTMDRITQRSENIGRFPNAGRRIPEYGRDDLREVIEAPYRILYRVGPERVDVLAVLHGARRLPSQL